MAEEERHAGWLELFFDLVVVAAVAQLAHRMHEVDGPGPLAVVVGMFYCVWNVWVSFTLYANAEGEKTRQRAMLFAMFGLVLMALSVPSAVPAVLHEEPETDRTTLFVIAFVVCRWLAANAWRKANKVSVAWPGAQHFAGLVPWIVSIWVDGNARYWLWGLGIVVDVVISVRMAAQDPNEIVTRYRDEALRRMRRRERDNETRLPGPVVPEPAEVERSHLKERLGLFVIIVLGEAVAQLVNATAGADGGERALEWTLVAAFLMLVGLWWLTTQYGFTPVPHGPEVRTVVTLPDHFVVCLSITAIAAGLGVVAAHPAERPDDWIRWIFCGGMAAYALAGFVGGWLGSVGRLWLFAWSLPSVVAAVLVGWLGAGLAGYGLVIGLTLVVLWQVSYRRSVRFVREHHP